MMNRTLTYLLAAALTALAFGTAAAASTDNHTVTVTIPAINEITVDGGNVVLTYVAPLAGDDFSAVSDATTSDLSWSTNTAAQKITVETNLALPTADLKITAVNVTGGTPTSQVTLSTTPADLITGIAVGTGGCDLSYVTEDDLSAGTAAGSDVHTVIYTITGS
jgi:hypothetical protein